MDRVLLCVALVSAFLVRAGELGPCRDVAFQATVDGTTQRYVERLPVPFDANETHHVMIALHGHGSDRWQFAKLDKRSPKAAQVVAAKYNMIYICPDYRAKTSWMGPKAEADVLQIIRALHDRYRVGKVFLVGGSMGATSSLTFAALHPDLVDGVAACNGLANHLEYENFQDAIRASFGGTKREIPLEYKKRSAEYHPEAFTMPVAVTTGGRDTSVPPDSVIRLVGVLRKMGRRVHHIHRPEGGHSTTVADGIAAMEYMVQEALGLGAKGGGVFLAGQRPESTDAKGNVEIGLRFSIQAAGRIKGLWFYQAQSERGVHVLRLWDSEGKQLAEATAVASETPGWQHARFAEPVPVSPGRVLVASYMAATHYVATAGVFAKPISRDGLTAEAGVYSFDDLGAMPSKTYKQMNYFVDVDYEKGGTE